MYKLGIHAWLTECLPSVICEVENHFPNHEQPLAR